MKILLFGASGSGTTTLGNAIEKCTDFKHLDADAYYWKKTNPPFQEKVPLHKRNEKLRADFTAYDNVVVSGSMVSWGEEWETAFDLAVFVQLENTERMRRLKRREAERYGEKLLTDQVIRRNSKAFLAWAAQYENPNFAGRTLKVHTDWMQLLDCKVLRLDGMKKVSENVEILVQKIHAIDSNT